MKLFATSVTIGSGGSGGVFAPSLFLGATLGGLVGNIVHMLFPEYTAPPGAYALVGMGAVAAGAMHAPITAILIVFELTNDYRIILPLMITCIISVLITTRLKKDSIYTLKLSRRGINIFRGREVSVLHSLKVSKVIKKDFEKVQADTPFRKLIDLTVKSPHTNFFVVGSHNKLIGIISIHDIRKIIYESKKLEPLLVAYDLLTPIKHYFTPNDTLDIVMKAFGQSNIDELPVVNKINEKELIGIVTKNDVIEIYNQEIAKKHMITTFYSSLSSLRKFKQIKLTEGRVLSEFEVPGTFVNKTLRELDLRNQFGIEVILIKQNYDVEKKERQKVITPEPKYRFKFGDFILIMGSEESLKNFKGTNLH